MNALLTSQNRLKLGLFGTNGGATLTRVPEVWKPGRTTTWSDIVEVAKLADTAGLEASLGYARWKSYLPDMPEAGPGFVMDPFTWAAGLSMVTSYTTHIATVHGSVMHPVLAAKQLSTLDHISGGRIALNLVGGWNKIELEMFGVGLKERTAMYDELEEWTQILRRLWTESEEFDFHGEYYDVPGGLSRPQPVQQPHPPIINAGASDRGLDFATTYADICFAVPDMAGVDARNRVAQYKDTARAKGREVEVWTYCAVVQRETRAEAEDYFEYFTGAMADESMLGAWTANAATQMRALGYSEEAIAATRAKFAAGSGGPVLIGTAADIADQMAELNADGLDGILLTWPDFLDGTKRLVDPTTGVLRELEARGLREPFAGPGRIPTGA
jgi:alkanesulfonate monooxygenase SsuD/methylene tetrahydromethanopterin reductase-like flavin-dependent oxidoreductase (luciferase family)